MKYIDADRLRAEIKFAKSVYDDPKRVVYGVADAYRQDGRAAMCDDILKRIDSLQQDETQVDKMLSSQIWWEEQGWIMIPPDATVEGIDSLLREVKKKLQQEQPEVYLEKEIIRYQREVMDRDTTVRDVALHFFELGQKEMRKRLSNPEYNKAVIEMMKSEYPAT